MTVISDKDGQAVICRAWRQRQRAAQQSLGRAGLRVLRLPMDGVSMKLGSLCTGYGGLDLAVEALLPTETVWLSEIDKNAAKVCEARFPDVPNLGDLTVIDWSQVEPVDVLTSWLPVPALLARRQAPRNER